MNAYFKNIRSILILLACITAWYGCKKDVFDYDIPSADEIKVDSVGFSVGTHTLLADGKSALNFIIQVYSKNTMVIIGVSKDSMVLVPEDRIPESSKKVFDANNNEVNKLFTVNAVTPSSLSFYAKVGNTQSVLKSVTIKAPAALPAKITIPVIFHVFELNKTDVLRYPWYDEFKYAKLQELLSGLNAIFNRAGTNNSNGASANVEFVLAPTGPTGDILLKPGYDLYSYASSFAWGFGSANTSTLIKANATKLLWNPKKYLNVWVLPTVLFSGSLATGKPKFTLSATPLAGITMQQATSINAVPLTEPENVGLMLGRAEFYSTLRGPAPNLAHRFGTFYGLFPTYGYSWDPTFTDFCDDTQIWDVNQYRNIYKKSNDGILFRAENIMDAPFLDNNIEGGQNLVSRLNNITTDQVKRIRYVLENCPERMAWQ